MLDLATAKKSTVSCCTALQCFQLRLLDSTVGLVCTTVNYQTQAFSIRVWMSIFTSYMP